MEPDRIVIGSNSERALTIMKRVYERFMAPIMVTDINSAELIKDAANSFLALKKRKLLTVLEPTNASDAVFSMLGSGTVGLVSQKTSLLSSRSANRSVNRSPF